MAIQFDTIVPWGRSFREYTGMFGLTQRDLELKIIGCGDGPASFNAEMTKMGKRVTSVDPLYYFSKGDIKKRIDETYSDMVAQVKKNKDRFIWKNYSSVDEVCEIRMAAMKNFLEDYDRGKSENRYIHEELPNLTFKDKTFDLALSSHFLFLYSNNLSLDFHIQSITEMLRVAVEVRIFPLVDLNAHESPYVQPVSDYFKTLGKNVAIVPVDYEFQKNGNRYMKISD